MKVQFGHKVPWMDTAHSHGGSEGAGGVQKMHGQICLVEGRGSRVPDTKKREVHCGVITK